MVELNKEELKKLSPEERIKHLRELEEERKREIAEAEMLIEESMQELTDEANLNKIEIPESQIVDITALFDEATQETIEESVKDAGKLPVSNTQYLVETADNDAPATAYENEWQLPEGTHMEETTPKYSSESKKADEDVTASKGVLEQIKKYTKG